MARTSSGRLTPAIDSACSIISRVMAGFPCASAQRVPGRSVEPSPIPEKAARKWRRSIIGTLQRAGDSPEYRARWGFPVPAADAATSGPALGARRARGGGRLRRRDPRLGQAQLAREGGIGREVAREIGEERG